VGPKLSSINLYIFSIYPPKFGSIINFVYGLVGKMGLKNRVEFREKLTRRVKNERKLKALREL